MALKPASSAAAAARSHASAEPLTTTCMGLLKFAGTSTPSPRAASHRATTASSVTSPVSATMVPGLASAASCIAWPRSRTSFRPSAKLKAPARCIVGPQRAVGGDRDGVDRGLGHVGAVELVGGAREAERGQVEAQHVVGLGKDLFRGVGGVVPGLAHAGGLGALAGAKNDRGGVSHGCEKSGLKRGAYMRQRLVVHAMPPPIAQ